MTRSAPDPLLERVREDPDAPALQTRSLTWSRAELLRAAEDLALVLAAEGVEEGDRLGCLLADDAPAVALVHSARRLRAVLVPLNRRATADELRYQLGIADAGLLVCDRGHAESARAAAPEGLPVERIEALMAGAPCGPRPPLREGIDLDAPAAIVFSSGTTGRPKGAVLSYDNQRASAHAWAALLRPRRSDRWLACLPLFHVAGLAIITRVTRWGLPLEVHAGFDPRAVSEALEVGVSHLSLVPAQLEALLRAREGRPVPGTLRAILLGGGPIPHELLARARAAGYPVLTTYGMTETGSGVAAGGADPATLAAGDAGRALPGVELRIGEAGADGSGEILVRGGMVFAGYVGDAAATGARLRDGWLHTGDIGTLGDDGLLRVLDRRDDLIVSGGENVYPAEVEAVLVAHPGVVEAAVAGLPDERWGAVPAAVVVPAQPDGQAVADDAELERHCRERLAAYKVPIRFVRVEALPRNDLDKVPRAAVLEILRREAELPHHTRVGGGPPLLLLHATLSSSRQLRALATRLGEHHTVISVDRRGSGRSTVDGPARPIDATVHVADLSAILEREGTGPAVVVGHSYGGCVALELAACRPDLVAAVFAYEPPYATVAPAEIQAGIAEVGRRTLAAAERGDLPGAALAFMEGVSGPEAVAALRPAARERVGRAGQGAVADATLSGMDPHGLRRITCPTLIATGSASRPLYGEIADALAARIPDGDHLRFEGLDHMAPVLRPDAIADAVERFLAR